MRKLRHAILMMWLGLLMVVPITTLAAVSSQQASAIAQQHVPGRVLAVNQTQQQGRTVYQVKILNKRGEVHVVLIDADSGSRIGN